VTKKVLLPSGNFLSDGPYLEFKFQIFIRGKCVKQSAGLSPKYLGEKHLSICFVEAGCTLAKLKIFTKMPNFGRSYGFFGSPFQPVIKAV